MWVNLIAFPCPDGCFTNILWAVKNNLTEIYNARNHIYGENFKLKLCMCAQKYGVGHTYKVSAWNSQKYDFCNTQIFFLTEYSGELTKC